MLPYILYVSEKKLDPITKQFKKKILTISGIKEARHQMWKVSHHRKRVFSLVKAVGFSVEKYFEGEVEAKISGVK